METFSLFMFGATQKMRAFDLIRSENRRLSRSTRGKTHAFGGRRSRTAGIALKAGIAIASNRCSSAAVSAIMKQQGAALTAVQGNCHLNEAKKSFFIALTF